MKRILCSAASLGIALFGWAHASPSSAALLTPSGVPIAQALAADQSNNIVRVTYPDRFYGQRWWWTYRQHPGKIRVHKSRYAYGCGRYNCYDGRIGYRNRIPVTSGIIRYPGCAGVCTYPNPYLHPDVTFPIVIH